jgi:hypothetical protein
MIDNAAMPPTIPARMDSIGKPGTGEGGIDVVVAVLVVLLVVLFVILLVVLLADVDVAVETTVV